MAQRMELNCGLIPQSWQRRKRRRPTSRASRTRCCHRSIHRTLRQIEERREAAWKRAARTPPMCETGLWP